MKLKKGDWSLFRLSNQLLLSWTSVRKRRLSPFFPQEMPR